MRETDIILLIWFRCSIHLICETLPEFLSKNKTVYLYFLENTFSSMSGCILNNLSSTKLNITGQIIVIDSFLPTEGTSVTHM